MSWSVSAAGKPAEVKEMLAGQFKWPLDEVNGVSDPGERETVRRIQGTIDQILDTFHPDQNVQVIACGHMGYLDWDTKDGAYQNVSLSVTPKPAEG